MRSRTRNPFTTVTTAGLLLPVDLLTRVIEGDPDLKGLSPKDYHLRSGERLNEAASRAWNECLAAWTSFRKKFAALPASDAGTTLTRDEWLLPLFQELGYGRLQSKKAFEIEGKEYPISHGWENHVPIHLLSARYPLDRRTPGVSGAATRAPYSLLQEQLNRSAQHRWGFVSNGLKLFLLRDNAALARAANVEFDLEGMMDGEHYADFMLMFLLCHQSRLEIVEDGKPEDCWLEKWANLADSQGTRAREKLRDGVETAIKSLGAGFLTTKGNSALRERLRTGGLSTQDYYRQLLRVVYRLLMLLVAEEKRTENGDNLFHPPGTTPEVRDRYTRFYSVSRIRSLAYERRGTAHTDLYESLKVLFLKLREGYQPLGIPGMGSFLFSDDSTPDLDDALLANQDLLDAFRNLCYTEDTSGRGGSYRRPVDFGNLGSEELGSVYESLLELHPQIDTDEGPFTLGTAAGHERKTTGSYYTPRSLINCLLDSALDPVVDEAIDVRDPAKAEQKLLDLKVCDPACGSGHFLIAAAERMATHLARIRTGDDQPNTLDVQHAKRDIIGRCIYGVDLNPMAVELCKVSLWMEALEPGKPLSFLDHHIQCGNSLLGTTPRLLAEGIPDDAFKPIEGDDKEVCKDLKKSNKKEREEYKSGQGYLFEPLFKLGNAATEFAKLTAAEDDSLDSIAAKQQCYKDLVKGADYLNARFWADTWCAVFVWSKDESDVGRLCPTERKLRDIERNPHNVLPHVRGEVERLSRSFQFHHWHLAFPDVFCVANADEHTNEQDGWVGGFDVVLGNPPWERVKLQEREWFSERAPDVAAAGNATMRRKRIAALTETDPELFQSFLSAKQHSEATSKILRDSKLFPLCGRGDVNTYTVFAELTRNLLAPGGRVGCIVPSGIATDDTTKFFFQDLMRSNDLASLFDFENSRGVFQNVHRSYKFCLLTMQRSTDDQRRKATFAFFLHDPAEVADRTRHLQISIEDIQLLNPDTNTCPILRGNADLELLLMSHRRGIPIEHSAWGGFYIRLIHLSDHAQAIALEDDVMREDVANYSRVYEAKLFHHFNHRYATFASVDRRNALQGKAREVSDDEIRSPQFRITPRYWVDAQFFEQIINRYEDDGRWLIGFRDIARSTDERTCIATVLPRTATTVSVPCVGTKNRLFKQRLITNLCSFCLDYISRQKVPGTHLSWGIFKQLPLIRPELYDDLCAWNQSLTCHHWLDRRVVELVFASNDIQSFAMDCGYDGSPFRWDEDRRFLIRCELDAAYFHLYLGSDDEWGADNPTLREMFPTPRDAVDYIMDTFPIVRRKDEAKYDGDYRTKRVILELYDAMAEAIRTGQPYQTRLDPPPGPPTDPEGNFIPVANWDPSNWPPHIHPPRKAEVP